MGLVAAEVLRGLRSAGATLATAESLTGGRLAASLTAVPGASHSYLGGVVAYATAVKVDVLGVPRQVVEDHGVISGPCALAMARGVAALTGADWAVATTGVAGPDRQEAHPPGTVYVAVVGPASARSLRRDLTGDREGIARQACEAALGALREDLGREATGLR